MSFRFSQLQVTGWSLRSYMPCAAATRGTLSTTAEAKPSMIATKASAPPSQPGYGQIDRQGTGSAEIPKTGHYKYSLACFLGKSKCQQQIFLENRNEKHISTGGMCQYLKSNISEHAFDSYLGAHQSVRDPNDGKHQPSNCSVEKQSPSAILGRRLKGFFIDILWRLFLIPFLSIHPLVVPPVTVTPKNQQQSCLGHLGSSDLTKAPTFSKAPTAKSTPRKNKASETSTRA